MDTWIASPGWTKRIGQQKSTFSENNCAAYQIEEDD